MQTIYAYTQHEKGEGLRIPKHKMNTNLRYDVKTKTQLLANIQFVGDRDDRLERIGGAAIPLVV